MPSNRREQPNEVGFLDALYSLFTYDAYSASILLPVIVALGELHPKGVFLEAIQVPRIDLPHHVLGLPKAWLAADSPAYTPLYEVARHACTVSEPLLVSTAPLRQAFPMQACSFHNEQDFGHFLCHHACFGRSQYGLPSATSIHKNVNMTLTRHNTLPFAFRKLHLKVAAITTEMVYRQI